MEQTGWVGPQGGRQEGKSRSLGDVIHEISCVAISFPLRTAFASHGFGVIRRLRKMSFFAFQFMYYLCSKRQSLHCASQTY